MPLLQRVSLLLALSACGTSVPDDAATCEPDATSPCAAPTQAPEHYVAQGLAYFDTLDEGGTATPTYAEGVIRWEWPPWLLLTGYGAAMIEAADRLVLAAQPGTTVPVRDCRAFDVQPFGRCRVVMDYQGKPCPIYEEFTFDPEGRMTFVEAWSDLPGLRPTGEDDPWAEGADVHRLSTRIPGLGGPTGVFEPHGEATTAAAATDPELADLVARIDDFWGAWSRALAEAGPGLYPEGCGW